MRSSFSSDIGLKLTRTPSARQMAYRRRLTALAVVVALGMAGGLLGVFATTNAQIESAGRIGPFSYFPS